MNLILISGDGIGAGKTTLATKLVGKTNVIGLAGALRDELVSLYPNTMWWDKTQAGKNMVVHDPGEYWGVTVRDALIRHGQQQCLNHGPDYWAQRLAHKIVTLKEYTIGSVTYAIDDLRKTVELGVLRGIPGVDTTHIHVSWDRAIFEPEFENAALREHADYIITRTR